MKTPCSIQIIDSHPVFRTGLTGIIESADRYRVQGESGSGRQGLKQALQLKPDIIIIDLALPDTNGFQLAGTLLGKLEKTRIIVFSMHTNINYVVRAVQAGAAGYVLKESPPACILECLAHVTGGRQFIDPMLSKNLCDLFMFINTPVASAAQVRLTQREQDVLRMIAENVPNKSIGERLGISPKTVESHRYNIMKKLGVKNRVELIRYSANIGLIDLDMWKQGEGLG